MDKSRTGTPYWKSFDLSGMGEPDPWRRTFLADDCSLNEWHGRSVLVYQEALMV